MHGRPMRTFDSGWITLSLAPSREITVKPIFRDLSFHFTDYTGDDTGITVNSVYDIDADARFDSDIFQADLVHRVARNSSNLLQGQSLLGNDASLEAAWTSWSTFKDSDSNDIVVDANCSVGEFGLQVFFIDSDGDLVTFTRHPVLYSDVVKTMVWADPATDSDLALPSAKIALAPVSASVVYLLSGPDAVDGHSELWVFETTGLNYRFHGSIYSDATSKARFDAVRATDEGKDYVFVVDRSAGRLMYTTHTYDSIASVWSDLKLVMPLDVVDTEWSTFNFGGASYYDGKIWITGRLKRGDIEMDIYLMGANGHFSLGRDMFISHEFATDPAGKLLLLQGATPSRRVVYTGYGGHSVAKSTMLIGADNDSDLELYDDTLALLSADISANVNSSTQLTAAAGTSTETAALMKRNAQIQLQLGYRDSDGNFDYETLGYFGVDVISPVEDEMGLQLGIGARGWASKKIDQWEADQSYEHWSQTKMYTHPATLTDVHQVIGRWETDSDETYLFLDELNVIGFLYSVHKPSRGASVSARFYNAVGGTYAGYSTGYEAVFGPALNYFRRSRLDAAIALGIPSEDVQDSDFGDQAIVAWYNGNDIGIYVVTNGVLSNPLASGSAEGIPDDTWYWLQMTFQDGWIRVMQRNDSDVDWLEAVQVRYDPAAAGVSSIPWFRDEDQVGRGAIFLYNTTPNSPTPGFSSTINVVPVEDVSVFPAAPAYVIADDELMIYDTVNAGPAGHSLLDSDDTWWDSEGVGLPEDRTLLVASGTTWEWAIHISTPWEVGRVILYQGDPNTTQPQTLAIGKEKTVVVYAGQAWNKGSYAPPDWPYTDDPTRKTEYHSTGIQLYVRKVGSPPGPLYVYYTDDDFDEGNPPAQGANILGVATFPSSDISSDFAWVEELWDSTVTFRGPDNDWIFITTMPKDDVNYDSYQDSNNYYEIMIDEGLNNTLGISRFWRTTDTWKFWYEDSDNFSPTNVDGSIVHRILGVSNYVNGHEIYVHGDVSDVLETAARDGFDDLALVVVEGPGKGQVFTITDYDYNAPNQWVWTRSYMADHPPDSDIGDSNAGYWTGDFYLSRFGVSEDPGGIIVPEFSKVRVFQTLGISQRGATDSDAVLGDSDGVTMAAAHGNVLVSIWDPARVRVDRMSYHSTETDIRLEDMVREISAKAGVFDFSAEKVYEAGDLSVTTDSDNGWTLPVWVSGQQNLVVGFDAGWIPASSELGLAFRANVNTTLYSDSTLTEVYVITAAQSGSNTWSLKFYKGVDVFAVQGVTDTFVDADSTLLTAHTPDLAPSGAVWTVWKAGGSDPSYSIQTNKVRPDDSGDGNARGYKIESGLSDAIIIIEGTVNSINPLWPELCFRGTLGATYPDDRGFLLHWVAESGSIFLYSPADAVLDTDFLALGTSDEFRITATLNGTSISVLCENLTDVTSVTLTATSSVQQTNTVHGFGARTAFGAGSQDTFDNFSVVELAPPASDLVQEVPLDIPLKGQIVISVQEEHFTVWCNDRFLWTFFDSDFESGEFASIIGNRPSGNWDFSTDFPDWSAVGRLVDGFILDMGSRGTQLLSSVLGRTDRRIFWQDTQSGGIRVAKIKYDGPVDFNLGDFVLKQAERDADVDYKSFIRSEGAGRQAAIFAKEVVDWDILAAEGFLFAYANAPLANNEWETENEAEAALRDFSSSSYAVSLSASIDARLEPNDIIDLPTDSDLVSVTRMVADTVSFSWRQEEDDVAADMSVQGRRIIPFHINAEAAAWTWTGTAATLKATMLLDAEAAAWVWTGSDADLVFDDNLLFYDTFTEDSDTNITSHTPDVDANGAPGWSSSFGTFNVHTSGYAYLFSGSGGKNQAVAVTTGADVVITCDITTSATDNRYTGIVFRFSTGSNYLVADINAATDTVYLHHLDSDSLGIVTSAAVTIDPSTTYALQIEAFGDSIKIYVDGVLKIDTTYSPLSTMVKHGLWQYDAVTDSQWDNFRVVSP